MCTAAQFTMSKTWKQPKYPSADGWIKKWYMFTVKYYSEMKKNERMLFAAFFHSFSFLSNKKEQKIVALQKRNL